MKKVLSVFLSIVILLSITSVTANTYARSSITSSEVTSYMNSLVGQTNNYSGYCLLFVTKCWENMGFAGSYGWGNATNFAAQNTVSTSKDNIPVGADVYFTSPDGNGHIGIYVGNGYFVHAGSTSTYEKSSIYETYYSNRYTGWGWHPNVTVVDDSYSQKPSNVKIALEKTSFFSNEHITYYCNGNDVQYFIISVYDDKGNIIETPTVKPNEYCVRYYNPGSYIVYCEAYNNCGNTFSNTISFTVTAPSNPSDVSLSLEKNTFFTDEHITYYCNGKNVNYYVISIYNFDGNIVETVKVNPGEYCIRYYNAGTYTAYCEAFNSCGETFSNNVKFTVKERCKTHIWNSGKITKSPTCTTVGTKTYICENCGEAKTETTKSFGHKWDSGKVAKKATPTATGVKTYTCSVCGATKTETIAKCAKYPNTLTAKGKKATVKFANLKKKNQTVAQKKAFTISKAQGKVTYKKSSGNLKITVSSTGKITIKKGLKKGTYKIKVKVTAAGNASYKAATKTVTVTIKVK